MSAVNISRIVLEADLIISLPKFKKNSRPNRHHWSHKKQLRVFTGRPESQAAQSGGKPERFHEMIVEVFRLRVPDLFLVDAVVGMEGNGPASPDLREIGLVLASDNAVVLMRSLRR